ncbi:MAG: DUF4197 domain-containing protein [Pseudomonadota bacterium]
MNISLIRCFVMGCLLVASSTAFSQSDWLQKGKDLLGSIVGGGAGALSNEDIGAGLKEALRVGTSNVVDQLGKTGGFNDDPSIHIPLPDSLKTVQSTLAKVGMSSAMDDLELRLNRAAEVATPKAKQLFLTAISQMTLDDVTGILKGSDDAATRYFQQKMTPELTKQMQPIVSQSLAEAGAIKSYDNIMDKYRDIPFVPDVKANLTDFVIKKGSDGIFHYLAVEEAQIRQNPAKRTTELLKRVFIN